MKTINAWFLLTLLVTVTGSSAHADVAGASNEVGAINPMEGSRFGSAVAIHDNHLLVVGADQMMNASDVQTGAMFLFEKDGDDWERVGDAVIPDDGMEGDRYGSSVTTNGDLVVVGAPNHKGRGAVYIYSLAVSRQATPRSGLSLISRLEAPDGDVGDSFGCSVSITERSDDSVNEADPITIVVGADSHKGQGAAYIFELVRDRTLILTMKLGAREGQDGDLFGRAVSVSGVKGQTIVVGAPGTDIDGRENQGAAYVYQRRSSENLISRLPWMKTNTLMAIEGADDDRFGEAVSIREASVRRFLNETGETDFAEVPRQLVVGAPSAGDDPTKRGRAFIYESDLDTAIEIAPPGESPRRFGHAVDIQHNQVLVGAPGVGSEAGRAFLFQRDVSTEDWRFQCLLGDVNSGVLFGHSVSLDFGGSVVGAIADDVSTVSDEIEFTVPRAGRMLFFEAALTLTLHQSEINEDGGSTGGLVTRTMGTSGNVNLQLNAYDGATFRPSIVTIPDGETSAEFTVIADDNDEATCQDPHVTVTASTPGFRNGTAEVTVIDDDRLLSVFVPERIQEGVAALATITRNTESCGPLTVDLTSSDPIQAAVASKVTFPAGSVSATFTLTAVGDNIVDNNQVVDIVAMADGFQDGMDSVNVINVDAPTLSLTIESDHISEDGGEATATLSRNTSTVGELVVTLVSSNLTEATVPNVVTIPDGSFSTMFTIAAADDTVVDGDQTVRILASTPEFRNGEDSIIVTDDDVPTLTLTIDPDRISENDGVATGTISRNTSTIGPLTVQLANGNPAVATLLDEVIIPVGSDSTDFEIIAVDDDTVNGDRTTGIVVSAAGFENSNDLVTIIDDDVPMLTLKIDSESLSEDDGVAVVTVTRNTSTVTFLTVQLASSDTTEAIVFFPEVIIPAGSASAMFTVEAVDDNLANGDQIARIIASATGFETGKVPIIVIDDDVPSLTLVVDPDRISETDGEATVTVSRNSSPTGALTIQLANSDPTAVIVPLDVTIAPGSASIAFTINAVDDDIANGNKTASIIASAPHFENGEDSVVVIEDDVPTLTLVIVPSEVEEDDGVDAIVSRNTNTTGPLTVQMASSDTSAVTVVPEVTIPAGARSTTFRIVSVDDDIVEGNETASIVASALGFENGKDSITVIDDDDPMLTLMIDPLTISEDDGEATATVSRNTGTTGELAVTLVSSDPNEAIAPGTVIIPRGSDSAMFLIRGVDDNDIDGNKTVQFLASAPGFKGDDDSVNVLDDELPLLTLVINPARIPEDDGVAIGTVRRHGSTAGALVVALLSGNTSEAKVPGTVTIRDGADSETFTIRSTDDDFVDGDQTVFILASAPGFANARDSLIVTDGDTPKLRLEIIPEDIREDGGMATATVSRNTNTAGALTVTLVSRDPSAAMVPRTVTIPDGVASTSFTVSATNDNVANDDRTTIITASALGFDDSDDSVTIHDDDIPMLTLMINPVSISENGGEATGTVKRNTGTTGVLTLALVSSDLSEASVHGSATILDGFDSATFTITAVDDNVIDGNQTIRITAFASGYASGDDSLNVDDDDVPTLALSFSPSSISEDSGTSIGTVVRNTDTTGLLEVQLASNDTTEASVTPVVTIPAGSVSATFMVTAENDQIVDGNQHVRIWAYAVGFANGVGYVTVNDDDIPSLTLVLDPAIIPEINGVATGTVTRNSVTTDALTVALVSDDPSEATVPGTTTIQGGSATATFTVKAASDNVVDGDQSAGIFASAPGFAFGRSSVIVEDNDAITFEDFPPTTKFFVGESFVDSGISMDVRPFTYGNMETTANGFVKYAVNNNAGHVGQDLNINNSSIRFASLPDRPVTLNFGETGGNLNLRVNGIFRNFQNMSELNGQVIGGATVTVTGGNGKDKGTLLLTGKVNEFLIGGQELWIDNVFGELMPDSLIGYWPFDDQAHITADRSSNSNGGAVNGNAQFVVGRTGKEGDFAILFDGEDDSVTTGIPLFDGLKEFTMSGWVLLEAEQANRTGFFGQNDSVEFGMLNATTIEHWVPAGGALNASFSTVGEWTHVAVSANADERILYINGEVAGTSESASPTAGSGFHFNIGGSGIFDAQGNFFNGKIDDVAVWRDALSAEAINQLVNGMATPLDVLSKTPLDGFTFFPPNDGVLVIPNDGVFVTPNDGVLFQPNANELISLDFRAAKVLQAEAVIPLEHHPIPSIITSAQGFVILFMGQDRVSYDLEHSEDLQTWTTIDSFTGTLSFKEPILFSKNTPEGYYRIHQMGN